MEPLNEQNPRGGGADALGTTNAEHFLRLSRDLFLVAGENGYLEDANKAWTELLGWSMGELHERPLLDYLHAEERAAMAGQLARLIGGEECHGFECRVLKGSGDHCWMSWSGSFDPSRRVFFLIGKDVHAQKESDAFSKLFFEAAPVGLNLCAMDGTWIDSNPSFLEMIDYTKEQANGKLTYWQLTPRRYQDEERLQLELLQREGKYGPYEKEFIRSDGSLVPVRLNGFIIRKDGQPFIWSIIEDISNERRLKAELEAKNALLEAIIENIPTALFVKDAHASFTFTLWNRAAEEVFHRPRETIVGKTVHDLWPKEQADGYLADDQEVVREGRLVDIKEEPSALPDGSTIFLHTKKFPLRLSEGSEPDLLLCISEDITERKLLEANLRAAIDVRDEFLSIASHELKTPLTALSLQLQLINRSLGEQPTSSNDPIVALARKAWESCRRMTALLNELLDITRIRAGKLALSKREVDLTASVDMLLALMSEEIKRSGSPIRISADPRVLGIWDPNRIDQVLGNLLSNALKFGGGKPIDISVREDWDAGLAILTVRDQGMGIPLELHEVIFRRFERGVSSEKISGLGLGLYIVRQVVEAHGGSVRVESAPGQGARFVVELPLKDAHPPPSDSSGAREVSP